MNNESKREKFVRLAEARTNKIIDMVQLLGNCSNTASYEYTEADVEKIFAAIEASIKESKRRFQNAETTKPERFTLS